MGLDGTSWLKTGVVWVTLVFVAVCLKCFRGLTYWMVAQ